MERVDHPAARTLENHLERYRRGGEPEQLGLLFDAAAPKLFRLALSILQDPSLAEDALQETFLDAFRHLDRHKSGLPVLPWLGGILLRNARKIARQARRRPDPRRVLARRPAPAPADVADGADTSGGAPLLRAIEALEEPYRNVAILRWHYGLEPAEIAHVRNQPPGTIRSLLARAREKLRQSHPRLRMGALAPGLRGLAAVRTSVLQGVTLQPLAAGAATLTATTLTGATLIGATLMWKYALGVGLLALLLGGSALWEWGLFAHGPDMPREGSAHVAGGSENGSDAIHTPALAGTALRSAAWSAATDGAIITGTVVDAEGAAVALAVVSAIPESRKTPLSAEDERLDSVTTDSAGRFTLLPTEGALAYALLARTADGRSALRGGVRRGQELELVLSAPATLTGHVLDVSGAPVAGARIHFSALLDALRFERSVTSAGDGSYEIPGIALPTSVASHEAPTYRCVEVRAEGFAPLFLHDATSRYGGSELVTKLPPLLPGKTASLDLVLSHGASYRGIVLRENTAESIVGGRVVLWSSEGQGRLERASGARVKNPFYRRILAETQTADDGSFSFDSIPTNGFHRLNIGAGGTYGPIFGYVAVLKDGYAPSTDEVPVMLPGAQVEAAIRLWPAATLEGRVLHADGSAAPNVHMWAFVEGRTLYNALPPALDNAPTSLGYTDKEGRFRLAGIPTAQDQTSRVTLRAHLSWAFRGQGHTVAEKAETRITIRAGETRNLPDLLLSEPKPPQVHVHILAPDGTPVVGATIFSLTGSQTIQTDEEGRARLLWPTTFEHILGKRLTIAVHAPGFALTKLDVVPAHEPKPEVEITLGLSHQLEGRVLDKSGRPVPQAHVTVVDEADPDKNLAERSGPLHPFPIGLGNAATDAEGHFVVVDLPAGPYTLQAYVQSGGKSLGTSVAGIQTDDTGVLLKLAEDYQPPVSAETGATFEGHIVEQATGNPIALFEVRLGRGEAAAEVTASRVRPGVFRFEGVIDGTWKLTARADGYVATSVQVVLRAGRLEQALRLSLSRGIVVRGHARKRGGSPTNHSISFLSATGIRVTTALGPDGAYEVSGLAPGSYTVSSLSAAWRNPKLPSLAKADGKPLVILPGSKSVTLDLTLVPAGALSVTATIPAVKEGQSARVELRDGRGTVLVSCDRFVAGQPTGLGYRILLPGSYRLKLLRADGTTVEKTVTVEVGRNASVQDWAPAAR